MMKQKQQDMDIKRSFSQLVLELVASADEVASLAKDSEAETEALNEFAIYLEKLSPILDTIRQDKLIMDTPTIRSAIGSLETELHRARAYVKAGSNPRGSSPVKHIQEVTHDLGRSLGLVLFASIGVSLDLKDKIGILHKEMMGAKFDGSCCSSSEREIEEVDDQMMICGSENENEKEDEIQEEGGKILGVEDVVLQLKYGNDDEFKSALLGLEMLVRERHIDFDGVDDEGIISILFNRLGSSKCIERLRIIKVLRSIPFENDQSKEKMADVNYLTTLVKSLARDEMERREAVRLLTDLSHLPSVRRRIGRIKGCIIMLVAILNGNDPVVSYDAEKLLNALSGNTQNALLMAESGYFQPLIQHLKQGSEMSKILMAIALSRMVLTDKNRASLGKDGAIELLVIMFKTGKLEAKLSALNALQNISNSTGNISYMLDSGILAPLLQLLFSVTSSVMTLREPASAILAKIAQSESILEYKDLPDQLLSLLSLTSTKIKCHVLLALNNIATHPSASEVRSRMNQNGGFQLLLSFLSENDSKIRTAALNLLYTISKDLSGESTEELIGEKDLQIIVGIISSSSSDAEKAAAVGLLSNIPVTDKKATDKLKRVNLLPILVSLMSCSSPASSQQTLLLLEESVAGVFIRFTLPSDKKLQLYAAEAGVIPVILKLLSNGSIIAKSRAALSLTQLAENSPSLRRPRNSRWGCVPMQTDAFCEVHDGHCTVKSGFCLVKAGAVSPLIRVLEGEKREADEAVLSALATLFQDNLWENGSEFITGISGGVEAIVRVLELGTLKAKEKALWILGRIFQIDDYRSEYGRFAQVVLISLAQKGEPALRPTVAKLLAQLELLQDQSSYF